MIQHGGAGRPIGPAPPAPGCAAAAAANRPKRPRRRASPPEPGGWPGSRGRVTFPFPLLSDAEAQVQKAWSVWKEKTMCGKKVMGTERTTVVVAAGGTVKRVFPKVKVDDHVREVLAAL